MVLEAKSYSDRRTWCYRYMSLRQDLPTSVFTSTWQLTESSECSATCGGGWTKGEITCTTADGSLRLGDDLCNPDARPVSWSSCNTNPCASSGGDGGGGGDIHFPSGDWLRAVWWWLSSLCASTTSLLSSRSLAFFWSFLMFPHCVISSGSMFWMCRFFSRFLLRLFVSSLHSLRPFIVILSKPTKTVFH